MEEELLSAPAVAPSATPDSILQILSGLAPRDPAATNPATTAAMARSRDAITRVLERQLRRQEDPFTGLNDVATAAQTALATRGKTPFGATLEQLDATRGANTVRTAAALGQQAQREGKGGVDPIKAANLVMRHIEQQSRNGDRDAREVDSFVKTLSANMEPASALRFQTSYGKAIADYVEQYGQNPDTRTIKMLVADYAAKGGFQTKLPNLQPDAFGNLRNVSPYGGGGAPAGPIPGREGFGSALGSLPPAGTPQPNEFNGPSLAQNAPGAAERRQAAPQGQMTPTQQGQLAIESRKQNIESQSFKALDGIIRDRVQQAGPAAIGPLGFLARLGEGIYSQIGALVGGMAPEQRQELQSILSDQSARGIVQNVLKIGPQSAGIEAGLLTYAYRYSKAMDPTGPVQKADLERALAVLGAGRGSVDQLFSAMDVLQQDVEARDAIRSGQNPNTQRGPQAGKVEVGSDGRAYQFKGGDPGDQKNWELIR